jgi:hypothetical protein
MQDAFKRALDANVRYYQALGQVTVDYWRAILGVFGEVKLPFNIPGVTRPAAPPPTAPTPAAASLALEADAGAQAVGVFLVDNKLPNAVSAPVVVSAFADDSGKTVRPTVTVDPPTVTLDPGGQKIVQISVTVDESLTPGTAYRAQVSVPGLSGGTVPLVLRRRAPAGS